MTSFGDQIKNPTSLAGQVLELFKNSTFLEKAKVELKPCEDENAMEVRFYIDCIISNGTIIEMLGGNRK